jgi:antitoxin CptB
MTPQEARLKMLAMRSWRRGMKEMDLIFGPFADRYLAGLSGADLDAYQTLLEENDQDLYQWVSGQTPPPARFDPPGGRAPWALG